MNDFWRTFHDLFPFDDNNYGIDGAGDDLGRGYGAGNGNPYGHGGGHGHDGSSEQIVYLDRYGRTTALYASL